MSELAEFTQLPPASLTRLIDGMVADNLVHRTPDPRDRRGVLVHLTERGLTLQARLSEQIAADGLLGDTDEQEAGGAAGRAHRARRSLALIAPNEIVPFGSNLRGGRGRMDRFRRTTRSSTSVSSRCRAAPWSTAASSPTRRSASSNADRGNAVVYPTWYSGFHWDNEWLIGDGMALDPAKYFIVVPNMLGNGLSSSPSNTPPPFDRARFPRVTFYDQVEAQHKLVTEQFGIETLALVTGWSMGAGQTYQWAVSHPDMVQRALPVLRLLEDQRAQLRLPRGRQGGADRRRRLQGGLVRRAADPRPARRRAGLRRLGLLPGLLLGPGLHGHGPLAPARPGPRLPVAGGLPGLVLGGPFPGPAA